ncbi:MAG: hypothetical protein OHK0045_25740 [Raineya sp.]
MKYLVKIDVSGIQSFIFDVPSKGAAKQLKARSVYVQAITHIAEEFFKANLQGESIEVLYNGGGNLIFYTQAPEKALQEASKEFQRAFQQENLFPIVAYLPVTQNFKTDMRSLAQQANIAKLQKPLITDTYFYKPIQEEKWKNFTEKLLESKGFEIRKISEPHTNSPFAKAGFVFEPSKQAKNYENKIINKIPKNKDGVTEFDEIAQKSTGDKKLAALKMDVDNLGNLFRDKEEQDYRKNSKYLSEFFEEKIYEKVLKNYISQEYIYPVFSGGDDCFFIGAWDKILEVASTIQKEFDAYQKEKQLALTLSAGVTIAPPKSPMVRLAEEAEHALELAKKYNKNKITLFGEPLTWQDFDEAKKLVEKFRKLIEEQSVSRALLHRIKSSDIGFTRLQEQAENGKLNFPKVHRLKYYLRNFKEKEKIKEVLEAIFKEYEKALIAKFMHKDTFQGTNPMVFPVAARWAELLTKSTKEKEE